MPGSLAVPGSGCLRSDQKPLVPHRECPQNEDPNFSKVKAPHPRALNNAKTLIPLPAAGESGAIVAAVPPHALDQLETSKWISLAEVLSGVEQPPPPVPARRGPRGRSEQLVRPFIGFALASVQAGSGGRIAGLQLLLRRCARRREYQSFTEWACMSRR
jgi:hypothetical protein